MTDKAQKVKPRACVDCGVVGGLELFCLAHPSGCLRTRCRACLNTLRRGERALEFPRKQQRYTVRRARKALDALALAAAAWPGLRAEMDADMLRALGPP